LAHLRRFRSIDISTCPGQRRRAYPRKTERSEQDAVEKSECPENASLKQNQHNEIILIAGVIVAQMDHQRCRVAHAVIRFLSADGRCLAATRSQEQTLHLSLSGDHFKVGILAFRPEAPVMAVRARQFLSIGHGFGKSVDMPAIRQGVHRSGREKVGFGVAATELLHSFGNRRSIPPSLVRGAEHAAEYRGRCDRDAQGEVS
jgi:hypothetical protein